MSSVVGYFIDKKDFARALMILIFALFHHQDGVLWHLYSWNCMIVLTGSNYFERNVLSEQTHDDV